MSKKKETHRGEQDVKAAKPSPATKEREYLEGWQRAKADYANLKKEMEDERQKAMFYSKLLILADLLPIVNNYMRAAKDLEGNDEAKDNNWAQGFIHIAKLFDTFLDNAGVTRIETEGKPFNPELHDAIDHEKKEGVASGIIIKEIEPGYKLNDSVIAAAKVIVAQ